MLQEIDGPHGRMKLVGSGFKLKHGGGEINRAPALLGEHANDVLAEAGYSDAEVAQMREAGVI